MKKSKILSSAFIMTMVSFGAFGADEIITGGPNTCTVDVLGVSDNNATANTIATWDLIDYTLDPGEYLNVTDTSVTETTCPAGSYCVGGGYTVETANNSIAQCPTTHPNSAEGAGADTQCYTFCTVDMVAKATAVSGNDYYGDGADTCEPTACIAGWHVKPGFNLIETIGEDAAINSAYINNAGSFYENNNDGTGFKGAKYYGITDLMSFVVDYGKRGMITGHGRCSTQAGYGIWTGDKDTPNNPEYVTVVNDLTDETGNEGAIYCYCQIDGFTPSGEDKAILISAPWVFHYDSSVTGCAAYCAQGCAFGLSDIDVDDRAFRATVLGTVPVSPATCAANTINIDWNPDNGGEHTKNMCTYEGAIEVPADPVKPGYTFTGWKLVD